MSTPDDSQAPKRDKARLFLLIGGKEYLIERVPAEAPGRPQGWRLTPSSDPEAKGPYCVLRHESGEITCECPSFVCVKSREGAECKHMASVRMVGLFPARFYANDKARTP